MFLRRCTRQRGDKEHTYWALVESYRTERGPRQRVVSYLGLIDEHGRIGVDRSVLGQQATLFDSAEDGCREPVWVEVDLKRIRVERAREFGGAWLGLELAERLGLPEFLQRTMPEGREEMPWSLMALILVLGRLCDPSSELYLAEHIYARTALPELLGVPVEKVNDDRLYRALDRLLPHKEALEEHLKARLGELFDLEYDLLLYDVTSTYFEGLAERNPLAQRGYSRDHRPDCKQVCLALVVTREGLPLGYELFAGDRADVTTVEEIVGLIEKRYGRAARIWVMDRGMVSAENIAFLKEGGRRYILGTPRSQLREFRAELLGTDWETVRPGLEVKCCPAPGGEETFILCRSAARREKERGMHARFERRIEEGLTRLREACLRRAHTAGAVERQVGRLLGQNTRAAGLFEVFVFADKEDRAMLVWDRLDQWREWADLTEGCYLLRSNITDWSAAELWQAYIQLTQAEAAFRIHKSDLELRPIWHQRQDRVEAHILVCFLAYVLWKTLGRLCHAAGLGDEPRKVFDELKQLRVVDVVLPTRQGWTLRRRCIARPEAHQAVLLQHLGLHLPESLPIEDDVVKTSAQSVPGEPEKQA
jgi:transposase